MGSIEEILSDGFYLWKRNKILGVPFLINFILLLVVFGIFIGTLIVFNLAENMNTTRDVIIHLIIIFTIATILFLIYMLAASFFYAGAIGMAKKTIENGKTSLSDMFEYGKNNLINLFIFSLISSILFFGLVVISFILMFLGIGIMNICLLILVIILMPFPYVIVIDNLGFVDSIKKGFRFIKENILCVVLLNFVTQFVFSFIFLIMISLALIFSGIFALSLPSQLNQISLSIFLNSSTNIILISIGVAIIIVISLLLYLFVLSPLMTIWWSKLYMDRGKNVGGF